MTENKIPDWQSLLDEVGRRFGLATATLAVSQGESVSACSYGWRDPDKVSACKPGDSLKIGSITKLVTAIGVMRLVDRGALRLDDKIDTFLDELTSPKHDEMGRVTVQHLLTHTSGIDGDFFEDTGDEDNCLARYAGACGDLPFLFEPGTEFSYCNAGFSLLGRICEVVSGEVWDDFVLGEVFRPLRMTGAHTRPVDFDSEDIVRTMQCDSDTGNPRLSEFETIRSMAPCGGTAYASVLDLIRLGQVLVSGGRTPDGDKFLSPENVRLMTKEHVAGPSETFARAWGLGVMHFGFEPPRRIVGHDGAVDTFRSMLRVDLDTGLVTAFIGQSGDVQGAFDELAMQVFAHHLEAIPASAPSVVPGMPIAPERFAGTYASHSARISVDVKDAGIDVHCIPQNSPEGLVPDLKAHLEPVDSTGFIGLLPGSTSPSIQRFLGDDDNGRAAYFHFRGRTHPRIE